VAEWRALVRRMAITQYDAIKLTEWTTTLLVSAKWLIEAGLEVVVFEKAAQLGGVWRHDDEPDSCAYKVIHAIPIYRWTSY
jgi:hypothetical protein